MDTQPAPSPSAGRGTRRRLRPLAAVCVALLAGTGLALAFLWNGGGGSVSHDDVLRANGITFAPPDLKLRGSKEKGMRFDIWLLYNSFSSRCLGSSISASRQHSSFYAGMGNAQKPGIARRMYEALPGAERYALEIPLRLEDARECVWTLREIQIQISDPFINDRREDLASFTLRPEAVGEPIEARYDVFCQKRRGLQTRLDCRHGSQTGRHVVVYSESVLAGSEVEINVRTSETVLPAK